MPLALTFILSFSLVVSGRVPQRSKYGDDTEDDNDPRMLPPRAHTDGWRHNHSEPDGNGNSHQHKFFPPARALALPGVPKCAAGGMTTGQAKATLLAMFS